MNLISATKGIFTRLLRSSMLLPSGLTEKHLLTMVSKKKCTLDEMSCWGDGFTPWIVYSFVCTLCDEECFGYEKTWSDIWLVYSFEKLIQNYLQGQRTSGTEDHLEFSDLTSESSVWYRRLARHTQEQIFSTVSLIRAVTSSLFIKTFLIAIEHRWTEKYMNRPNNAFAKFLWVIVLFAIISNVVRDILFTNNRFKNFNWGAL